jgi:plasmid maintenance system killer protein
MDGLMWQPIETAPKENNCRILGWDGFEILTLDYVGPYKIGINKHISVGDWWVQVSDSGRSSVYYPTHWMSLPDRPE